MADLKEIDSSWPVHVRFFNTSSYWGILPISLHDQLLFLSWGVGCHPTRVSIMTSCFCFVGTLPFWSTGPLAYFLGRAGVISGTGHLKVFDLPFFAPPLPLP